MGLRRLTVKGHLGTFWGMETFCILTGVVITQGYIYYQYIQMYYVIIYKLYIKLIKVKVLTVNKYYLFQLSKIISKKEYSFTYMRITLKKVKGGTGSMEAEVYVNSEVLSVGVILLPLTRFKFIFYNGPYSLSLEPKMVCMYVYR